jgi:malate synthase
LQWVHHGVALDSGTRVTSELVRQIDDEELGNIRSAVGEAAYARSRPDEARAVFERVALAKDFVKFLTLPAYELID